MNTTKDPLQGESEILFDKKFTCPICENNFVDHAIKTGKARMISSDIDSRRRHKGIDIYKYDLAVCPKCGYAASQSSSSFGGLSAVQVKLIKEKVQANFKGLGEPKGYYDYETAVTRYKFAILCAMVRMAKSSEAAYLCLKLAWLYRGWMEELTESPKEDAPSLVKLAEQEQSYLKRAYEGFKSAFQTEEYPICGMDEATFDYFYAVLAIKTGDTDSAKRRLSNVISSKTATQALKEKARDAKDLIIED